MHLCALQGTEQLGGTTLISLYDSLFYPLTPDLRCIHHTGLQGRLGPGFRKELPPFVPLSATCSGLTIPLLSLSHVSMSHHGKYVFRHCKFLRRIVWFVNMDILPDCLVKKNMPADTQMNPAPAAYRCSFYVTTHFLKSRLLTIPWLQSEYEAQNHHHSRNLLLPLTYSLPVHWSARWNLHFPFRLQDPLPRSLRSPIHGFLPRITYTTL